ncbi:MAG: HlyD family efflux transporter periplasmic adaptor subunit [Planctomycetota bacterium]
MALLSSTHRRPLTVALLAFAIGCGAPEAGDLLEAKRPRPVSTRMLEVRLSPSSAFVAASVASWKTEEIGFEVSGRVEWVTEKNAAIEGRIEAADGQLMVEGSPVARIDPESYELGFEIAKAELARAEQQVVATQINLERTVPAQLRAADSDRRLAEIEVVRSRRLVQTNAVSQSELDGDEAELATAISQVEQLTAQLRSTEADLVADRLAVEQARQSLRDAERDLENCVLYSSFRGQIAEVTVVPGSVVSSGAPVVTIQMMDPIKIAFEVSGKDSRLLAQRQQLPFVLTGPDGTKETREALVYQIDPVADPATRTFTVTLLAMNETVTDNGPEGESQGTPVIEKAWRTDLDFLPGAAPGRDFVIAESIERDDQGTFVWQIDNVTVGQVLPSDRLLRVSKLRVSPEGPPVPFLGEFFFQAVRVDDSQYDGHRNLVTGPLTFPDGDPSAWDQSTVRISRGGRWLLRPGDLVMADLSGAEIGSGLYVPMDAISYSEDKTFVFIVEPNAEGHVARRVEVAIDNATDAKGATSFRSIAAIDGESLVGSQYVVEGVHYLVDGEKVRPVASRGQP